MLARLFFAPPDPALLESIAGAEGLAADDAVLRDTWHTLTEAAAHADAEALREAYDSAFIGTGKSPVSLYTTAYTVRSASEVPLVALRAELVELGLARHASSHEPEDHIAALCDVMRHLIATQECDVSRQARFFNRWIAPAAHPLCDAIAEQRRGTFYEQVARFARAFFELERTAFELFAAGTRRTDRMNQSFQ
ncbi:MAG: molecular chaperone TorD family protein [Burkholderiales bacterium]|nr:molecular chaperone TorD family protein [Burkholderiales bacterium]